MELMFFVSDVPARLSAAWVHCVESSRVSLQSLSAAIWLRTATPPLPMCRASFHVCTPPTNAIRGTIQNFPKVGTKIQQGFSHGYVNHARLGTMTGQKGPGVCYWGRFGWWRGNCLV